jgi:cardiolipin synthase
MQVMSSSPDATTLNVQSLPRARQVSSLRAAPNLLTLLRMCLIPLLVGAVWQRHFGLAFGLFLVASCTDAMDGLVARWLKQGTMLGQYLDPAADKLLLSSLFVVLTLMKILDPKVAIIVFGRDLGMSLSAAIIYWLVKLKDFRPTFLGKANSFSQVVAIGMVLLSLVNARPFILTLRQGALDATIFLTVVSGFHYAWVVSQRIDAMTDQQISGK